MTEAIATLKSRSEPIFHRIPWYWIVNPLFQVTAVWCLFSFKIFLISFGEAGLRPDDILIFLSFVGLLVTRRLFHTPISLPLRLYFVYVSVQFASAVWNSAQGRVNIIYSLVFVTRVLEYTCFYFIGYSLARTHFRMDRLIRWYFYIVCVLVPLQMAGLLPVPGTFNRLRISANTNGPYEFAIVCGFLLCYLAYRARSVVLGVVSVLGVFLTASRITLLATILSVIHFGLTRAQSKVKSAVVASVVVAVSACAYLASQSGLLTVGGFDRIQNSSSYTLADIKPVYDAAPVAETADEYFEGSFKDLNGLDINNFEGDASGVVRFTRWITLTKAVWAHQDTKWIGLGPSFGSAAVDGYFTRCYAETGALGLISFSAFVASLLLTRRGSTWYFRDYAMIMIVSAFFIDIFLSYKCMLLMWLWHGVNQYQTETARQVQVPSHRHFHLGAPSEGNA